MTQQIEAALQTLRLGPAIAAHPEAVDDALDLGAAELIVLDRLVLVPGNAKRSPAMVLRHSSLQVV